MSKDKVDVKATIKKNNIGPGVRVVFKGDPQAYYVKSWVGDIQNVPDEKIAVFVTTNSGDTYKKFLRNLIKVGNNPPIMKTLSEGKCNCGCGGCSKAPILNESLVARTGLSEGILWHIDNKKPLTEHLYRAGSDKYFKLWEEARYLYSRDLLEVKEDDLDILLETDLGHFGLIYEIEVGDKVTASKEYGGLSGEVVDIKGSFVVVKTKEGNKSYHESDLKVLNKEGKKVPLDFIFEEESTVITEAEKKKNPPLGKPKRGGSKKFYVYVRDPKTKNIKKVSFGQEGMSAKINNPKARAAFSKRHNCPSKKDKTKASYWSCRLPRYAKLLGLKSNFSGFW
jgi:hypothetical protein